jgi:hypothetical protein
MGVGGEYHSPLPTHRCPRDGDRGRDADFGRDANDDTLSSLEGSDKYETAASAL